MKAKILLFKPYTMLEGAGNKIWFFKIIPELTKLGYSFIIVDTDLGPRNIPLSELNIFCKKYNVKYVTLRTYPFVHLLRIKSFLYLLTLIREVDLIYYVTAEALFDPYFFLISLARRVIGGWHAPFYFDNSLHNLYQKMFKPFFCKFFMAHHVVAPSQAKLLVSYGLKNVQFIPHGVQIEKFKPTKNKWNKKVFTILFVGRFEKQKGFDILVDAMRMFLNENKKNLVSILLVGGGSLKKLAQFRDKRITVAGFIKDPAKLFAKAHVFLLPSRQEPWGHVVLEAMSSSALVVTSQTEGPKYIIGNSHSAWFLKELNAENIVILLEKAYTMFQKDRKKFIKVAKEARKVIKQKYDFTTHIKKMDLFFRNNL